jgi:hypothetical protein
MELPMESTQEAVLELQETYDVHIIIPSTGGVCTLRMSPSDTVGMLKKAFYDAGFYFPDCVRLVQFGRQLSNDESTLIEEQFTPDIVIHAIPRLGLRFA